LVWQLVGGFVQVAMHSPRDSEPAGSGEHWPVIALQLYIAVHGVREKVGAFSHMRES
jgi:hypothetical protein